MTARPPAVAEQPPRTGAERRARLATARLYFCTPRQRCPDGVDLVQLRRKGLEWREEVEELTILAALARARNALVSANDRADVAAFTDVDILHVGQDDLPPRLARRIVGPDVLIGLSSHDERQLEAAAADPDVDYFCVGPVWATPTKAGRPAVGLDLLRRAVEIAPPFHPDAKPWFVTGGVAPETLDDVLGTGARRVVVVRALTEADDPDAVGRELAARLAAA
ncbi:MAG TPA: thiamine phosphate synthase [Frankiaceae bacterium]|nr:thiamine phosphate synthase [Frankiaceae bacterium]